MVLGNLQAIPRPNIKRMMAYSSIAQAGYISTGFLAGGRLGLTALLFYLFIFFSPTWEPSWLSCWFPPKRGATIEDSPAFGNVRPLSASRCLCASCPWRESRPSQGRGEVVPVQRRRFAGLHLAGFAGYGIQCRVPLLLPDGGRAGVVVDPKDSSPIPVDLLEKVTLVVCILVTVVLGFWPTPLMQVAQAAASSLY